MDNAKRLEIIEKQRALYGSDFENIRAVYSRHPDFCRKFWVRGRGRKIHTGFICEVIDRYADIAAQDLNGISVEKNKDIWESIKHENDMLSIVEEAVKQTLICGDGAFKISFDSGLSQYPIVEFVPGDRTEFVMERGRVKEVVFLKHIKEYVLRERYIRGGIIYELRDIRGKSVSFEEAKICRIKNVYFKDDTLAAVPFYVFSSPEFSGRGKPLFASKEDIADALDEIVSQWMEAVRKSRTKKYIPEGLIPRDKESGAFIKKGLDFDDDFVTLGSSFVEGTEQIQTINPLLPYEGYSRAYLLYLDMLLSGVISPSTLGIDLKKTDNATSQREKEKITLYIRGKIVCALSKALKSLAEKCFKVYSLVYGKETLAGNISVSFGEYAQPDFSAVVNTVATACKAGIMSKTMAVEELYGNTLSKEEKKREVERLG